MLPVFFEIGPVKIYSFGNVSDCLLYVLWLIVPRNEKTEV